MAKLLRLEVAQLTDVGRRRDHNEDNMAYVIPKDPTVMTHKGALLIVADGMGGHAAGEVASEIAVETISNTYYQDENDDVPTSLMQAIRRANAAIQQRAAENMLRSGMGTTCVAAVIRGNMAYVANIGDSRAYVVRQARLRQVSQDHSWVAEQVRAGLLTEEQARNHAQRNVITRSLGTQYEVDIDIFREPLEEGDMLLLCSDGLSGMVNDEELLQTLSQFVPQESVYHLIDRANENGGIDNITAIVAQIQELGVEPPSVRQPVLAGGPELSNEDTARLVVSPAGGGVAHSAESPLPGNPFPAFTEEQLASSESDTAPQPIPRAKKQHGRLFLPTIVLLILFILVAGGGGGYYFIHMSQVVSSTLNSADQLITRANSELSANPAQALQDLATAQQQLRSLPGLNGNDSARLIALQTRLVNAARTAITDYNQTARIVQLPCANTAPGTLSKANGAEVQSATVLQAKSGTPDSYYTLGQDGKIYALTPGASLQPAFSFPASDAQVTALVGSGDKIFALSSQTDASGKVSYNLNLLSPTANATTLQSTQTLGIDPTVTQNGNIPSLITAWGNNIYVLLLSRANPNAATILSYTAKDTFNAVQKTPISVSDNIVSATAFPNQLFLLLADGSVLTMQINPTDATLVSSSPAPVLLHTPIALPLVTSAQSFTSSTSVPTVPAGAQKGNGPLTIPMAAGTNPALLSAGQVSDGSAHLFIGDPTNHRVLDLTIQPAASSGGPDVTPTASPTGNVPGNSITLNLVQQYVSSSYFTMIKSVATDPGGTTLYILGQNTQNAQSLMELSAGSQQACAS